MLINFINLIVVAFVFLMIFYASVKSCPYSIVLLYRNVDKGEIKLGFMPTSLKNKIFLI